MTMTHYSDDKEFKPDNTQLYERLAKIEAHLEAVTNIALVQKADFTIAVDKLNTKLDKILNNDTDKIARIVALETNLRTMTTFFYVFGVALIGLMCNLIIKWMA